MARALLALQSLTNAGLEATYTAATVDGLAFDNRSEKVFLHVKNGGGVDTTVTIETPGTYAGLALPDRTVVVTAGEECGLSARFRSTFSTSFWQHHRCPLVSK